MDGSREGLNQISQEKNIFLYVKYDFFSTVFRVKLAMFWCVCGAPGLRSNRRNIQTEQVPLPHSLSVTHISVKAHT